MLTAATEKFRKQSKTHRSADFVIKRIACLLLTTLAPLTDTRTSPCAQQYQRQTRYTKQTESSIQSH